MTRFVQLISILCLFLITPFHSIPNKPASAVHYFLVMGQSNAVTNDYYGFGNGFKEHMKKLGYPNVVLIPTAVGGTGIDWWQKGNPSGLYNRAISEARATIPANDTLDGVIFFQGEHETQASSPYGVVWGDMFGTMVSNLREDFNDPGLPVVFAQIACFSPSERIPNCWIVQNQQESVNEYMVSMITTSDLPYKQNDPTHLTDKGYTRVGVRFANEMYEMICDPMKEKNNPYLTRLY
jgi:hypothetical protein